MNNKIEIIVSNPTVPEAKNLTEQDVWGIVNHETWTRETLGMIVASSMYGFSKVCPVWGDVVPNKSVTIICEASQVEEVVYWLEFVHGGNSVSNMQNLADGKIAIRSDYQCW